LHVIANLIILTCNGRFW